MKTQVTLFLLMVSLIACANEVNVNPTRDFEEVDATTILDAPTSDSKSASQAEQDQVRRGEYMVELLGCASCHTDGALEGDPDLERPLAGSNTGIAYTSPLDYRHPGVVFAPNITSDVQTGIGGWEIKQLMRAIRRGQGRHGGAASLVMPWPGYAKLSDEDAMAIARYLKSVAPVSHSVPNKVSPGKKTNESFVYFGFYRKTDK